MLYAVVVLGVLLVAGALWLLKTRSSTPETPAKRDEAKLHWLVALSTDVGKASWHLGDRRVTAGRAPSNYIQIATPGMSRQHAAFYVSRDGVRIVDMTSSNGTLVNGKAVQEKWLKEGDKIELAGARFVYRREGDFGPNAGFRGKEVDDGVSRTTVMPGDVLELRVHAVYELNGRDLKKTAAEFGLPVDEIQQILDKR
ncbi:MAG: FHA domain-containing protein [Deltaproteobacteria bacterium]|nr:FHA domain-containing protein [Deltaproteobacteria bacterium]